MDRTEGFENEPVHVEPYSQEEIKVQKKSSGSFFKGMLLGILLSVFVAGIFCAISLAWKMLGIQAISVQKAGKTSVVNSETLQKMQALEQVIDTYYYGDEVTEEELQNGVYKGIVAALDDPYSEYYSKEELEEALSSNQGVSFGIGAYISMNQQMQLAMISGVMEGSPAQGAGLREGDIIYEVDGESTQGLSLSQVVSRVKGPEGTTVHLTIYREGEPDYLKVDIVREKMIETETVQYGMLEEAEDIGYLRITEFDEVTVDQYTEAMAELNGHGMKGLILDLRSNPGGDLDAVVEISRKILPEGLILYTEDKEGGRKEYTCDGSRELQIPLVVLVNEYSASASEILAGAIQDYNKGTLIGTTTYGKGIVQRIHSLDDGTAIKLTVSAYFTPAGRNIHGVGIEPDIVLEYDYEANEADGTDNQVDKAIEVLEGKIG